MSAPNHCIGIWVLTCLTTVIATADAHVPYLEDADYDFDRPFPVEDPTQSIAVYSWLENSTDVDVYRFTVSEPTSLFAEVLVPVCPDVASFFPRFALIGPGLPEAPAGLPFTLPDGYGALVVTWDESAPREVFFEPFGNKEYYDGPNLNRELTEPGEYMLVYWDAAGRSGDYVAVIGDEERWPPPDILRALRNTPVIRRNGELHGSCATPSRPSGFWLFAWLRRR